MPKNIFNSLKRYVDRAKSNARSAAMRASYVDTRSDTTRKGYHEGRTRYGYNYGANENGITGTIARVIEGKDHNPYLQTGIAPMPDKIASSKDIAKIYKVLKKSASKITPKQWTALQDAAIARGDMAEVQRLRDLHFKVSAPNTKQTTPMYNASGESTFNEFNGGQTGLNWFSESKEYAANHGVPRAFYLNEPDIYLGNVPAWKNGTPANKGYIESLKKLGYSEDKIAQKVQEINEAANSTAPAAKSVGKGHNNELVTRNNNTIKLADAVTYDDNGVRIPLGERDNFNVNDIRWSWLLPVIGAGAATAVNTKNERRRLESQGKKSK